MQCDNFKGKITKKLVKNNNNYINKKQTPLKGRDSNNNSKYNKSLRQRFISKLASIG